MEFREFSEFDNPEAKDYDIHRGTVNPYIDQLVELIGIPEDVTEEEFQEQYGISMEEFYNPTQETIDKVSAKLSGRHRK